MSLTNVKLILAREIRDQLRDRRTLFMIVVLPILLYPLLGMSLLQLRQFMREQPTSVWVIGARNLPEDPPLVVNGRFAEGLFGDPGTARLLELHFARDEAPEDVHKTSQQLAEARRAQARRLVQSGEYDVALYVGGDFGERLEQAIRDWIDRHPGDATREEPEVPDPEIFYSTANDRSQIALGRLLAVFRCWKEEVLKTTLAAGGMPPSAAKPFDVATADVAGQTSYRGAALWSKILPVLLLIWAMTGAFYPAVDLCAGEKERGTLETLLSSPAQRSEIVVGKLLTIMLFSMVTAGLNLLSVGVIGWLMLGRSLDLGPPPPTAIPCLAVALVPVSALFSALSLALAALARSTKEGQYYLMPLLLITMPLAVLPMAPGVELNLGNSLIPVTGMVLLLRDLLEGADWQSLHYLPLVVVAVTLAVCLVSIRWAVDQFNSESVLFREGEQFELGLWFRRLMRDRQPTPSIAAALLCGVLILVIRFYMSSAARPPGDFGGFAKLTLLTQLAVVAAPALVMTVLLTSRPRETLILRRPPWLATPAALLLAVTLHPAAKALQEVVARLYPVSEEIEQALRPIDEMFRAAPFWPMVLVLALTPAICEELAFRGFILSGFRRLGHKWRAIIYTAVFFGLAHAIWQQILIACLVGVVIGYVAVQSGSLLPGVAFHLVHNTLLLATTRVTPELLHRWPILGVLMRRTPDGGYTYPWPAAVAGGLVAALLLLWFRRLAYHKSDEERLQEAIERGLGSDHQ